MLLLAEHYDGYVDTATYQAACADVSSALIYRPTDGRWGGGAVENSTIGLGDLKLLKNVPGSNMIRIAFHIKCNRTLNSTGNRPVIKLQNATPDRYWRLIGDATTFCARLVPSKFDDTSATNLFAVNATHRGGVAINDGFWHHVEIALSAHTSTGSFKMWIDGVEQTEYTITSGDTSDAVSGDVTAFDRIYVCGSNSNTSGVNGLWIDDIIVWDDTAGGLTGHLPAEHRLRKLEPTADGSTNQWTPLAGFAYANVDDTAIDGDTSYISETVAGQIDYFTRASLGWTPNAIQAVIVESIGKMDTGTHTWRNKLKSSAAVANGTALTATTTYVMTKTYVDYDPNTSAVWSQANLEAAEFGVEFVS